MSDGSAIPGRAASPTRCCSTRVIAGDAVFLGFMAVFGMVQDILSYQLGAGRFDAFLLGDPRALGFVEAHGLAGMIAVAAFVHARQSSLVWHALLGGVHAFLGSCNLLFFDAFVMTDEAGFAIFITILHYAFAVLHAGLIVRSLGQATSPVG